MTRILTLIALQVQSVSAIILRGFQLKGKFGGPRNSCETLSGE